MAIANRSQADWGEELTIDASTFTGAAQTLGVFTEPPSMIIIQNDTNVTVSVRRFTDSSQTGISFGSGTKLVLDMETNRALADFFSFPANTTIQVSGTSGAGDFKIAYIHGKA